MNMRENIALAMRQKGSTMPGIATVSVASSEAFVDAALDVLLGPTEQVISVGAKELDDYGNRIGVDVAREVFVEIIKAIKAGK